MKLSTPLVAIVGATVLLGALVTSASAGRLSYSTQSINASWTRMNIVGAIGTVECEVIINRTLHSRTVSKTPGLLHGTITAANISRCSRGGGTVLRETLPWSVQYSSFSGTLPNISSVRLNVIGASFRIREPTFGIEALATSTSREPLLITDNISGGVLVSATAGGTITCGSFTCTVSGTSSSITAATVTLI